MSFYDVPITGKRLELLRELIPKAELIAVLLNSSFAAHQFEASTIETAARTLGQKTLRSKLGPNRNQRCRGPQENVFTTH